MEELKKIYGFTELMFYVLFFMFFLMGIFLRNNIVPDVAKAYLFFIDVPFLVIALVYGLLSIRFKNEENSIVANSSNDGLLILIGFIGISLIVFLNFAYPSQI